VVFTAVEVARGDVLMVLHADLTMRREQLPKFWQAVSSGRSEFVYGRRLIYPMEDQVMRFLILIVNKICPLLFAWLLLHRVTHTLRGAKVIMRSNYERLRAGRS
jgi:hypothetical protein